VHFATDLLEHVKAVKACADEFKFSASVNLTNLALDIDKDDLSVRFQPRFFVIEPNKGRNYTLYFNQDALAFVGWLPYFNKVWPIALDKLAFKSYAREHDLRTPDWWTEGSPAVSSFLVKRKNSSLGVGMRGPFRTFDPAAPDQRLGEAEYYERFIEGRIAKIWYWNADPVCLELQDFPQITGDGTHSIKDLLKARLGEFAQDFRWPSFERVIRYRGKQLDTVLGAGEVIGAGFRYNSLLEAGDFKNRNVLAKHSSGPVGEQLRAIGKTLWPSIPEDIRTGVVFTIDAVLDDKNLFWLLEMNPNPSLHPDVYAAMLASVVRRQVSGMPSTEKLSADAPALKGGLVWARGGKR
jgi:hypothetical protein